jgi:enamine deaminase RidA (YjgF/YER057c/UK114 family)
LGRLRVETWRHHRFPVELQDDNGAYPRQGRGMKRLVSTGSPFEERIGYSRAVVCDGWIFVAGTTGYDYATMTMPATIAEQCRNTLATIAGALSEAGATLDDVVRVRYIVPDPAEWPECWPITSEAFSRARPAATMISAALQEPEMKIEIEVTARVPGDADRSHGAPG